MKKFLTLAALLCSSILGIKAQTDGQTQLSVSDINSLYTTEAGSWVSIHDPSVVLHNGLYTVWGSHLGVATSTDLITWTPKSAGNTTFRKLATQGATSGTNCTYADAFNTQQVTKVKNYKGEEVDFPNFDAEAYEAHYAQDPTTWVNGTMWAPDIIYNEQMKKWCMYLSLNGDNWASIIILLTSASSTGPFTYQGPVVMGGFTGQTYTCNYDDGTSKKIAAQDVANTDLAIATGETSLPARYKQSKNGTYWPNCIDPCVFYDEEGELWMSYGSWSGGIFMLKLDKETGLRDYTYTYTSDYNTKGASGTSDPYYGKKIAGGYYVSGEGSYIQHIGDYYYLFMSYGGFAPNGGYEMRIFRSTKPDGDYVDGTGTSALYTGYQMNYGTNAATNRGMKLMGSYNNWGNENVGECAQGHNSACIDDQGRAFVVYHTKFNDGTAGHQVRVHQLFTNEKGWLVAAPFMYAGETTTDADIAAGCPWTKQQLAGTYHLLIHPYKMDYANYQESTPVDITLAEDGKITGAYSGTWTLKDGTAYVTLKLGSTYYYGVLCEQQVNGSTTANMKRTSLKAIAFTAQSTAGVSVWGYKLEDQYAVAYNYKENTIAVKSGNLYSNNIELMFPTTENTTLTWTSSNPTVINETGKYNPAGLTESVPVTLTARLDCGDYYWEQAYDVKANKENMPSGDYMSGLVAYYNFDESPCYNAYNTEQKTTLGATGTKPTFVEDYNRFGKVLHQSFGAQGSNSYTKMTNPLLGNDSIAEKGMTISMWVKRTDQNRWDALWSFFSGVTAGASGARVYLTGNSYIGYNDNAGTWFDINHPGTDSLDANIPVGKWSLVTVTVGSTNGVATYVNGAKKAVKCVSSSNSATTVKNVPYESMLEKIATLKYLYLGLGSFWGSADAYFDDLMVFDRELTSTDVRSLNTMCNRVFDFTTGKGGTGIEELAESNNLTSNNNKQCATYDLSGRRVSGTPSRHGIYIVNGRKVIK